LADVSGGGDVPPLLDFLDPFPVEDEDFVPLLFPFPPL
jgi:hypothetical protein